jgi:hypothetical protein
MNATSWIETAPLGEPPRARRLRAAANGGVIAALLFVAASLGGLALPDAYARETPSWAVQGIAQDWFDLIIAGPALLIASLAAWRGSRRGQLVLGGFLLYAIYTLIIYAFGVHLNALFLVYCAGLSVALYSLIALARSLGPFEDVTPWNPHTPRRSVGAFLIFVGVAFGGLWLMQLIPAALHGTAPKELVETGLFTNPIHVLDLSFILPLHVIAGVWLWRRRSIGVALAAVVLAFGVLMAASIGVLVVMMELSAISGGGLPVAVAMAAVSLSALGLLTWLVRTVPE